MKVGGQKPKYVVFGASGFIGKNIIESLASTGCEIIAVSRLWADNVPCGGGDERVTYVQADLSDQSSYCNLLDESAIVIDLAYDGLSNLGKRKYVQDVIRNIFPHVELFECCVERQVRGVVFVSSGGTVYGSGYDSMIGEKEHTSPTTSYACSKLSLEHFLKSMCTEGGVDYMIVRPSNPYGKYQNARCGVGLISRVVHSAYSGDTVNVFGDGSLVRDYIHITDLCDAMVQLINKPEAYRDTYNIGCSVGHSINDIISIVEQTTSKTLNVEYKAGRHTDLKYNVLCCSKLRGAIGWAPSYTLEEGVKDLCCEVRSQLESE